MIRLLLVDSENLVLEGMKTILNQEPDLNIVGTANNADEAITKAETLQPDMLLVDGQMPAANGRTVTKLVCERFPDMKVLVLNACDHDRYIADSLRAGAKGYLVKDMLSEELPMVIRQTQRGHTLLAPHLSEQALARLFSSGSNYPEFSQQVLDQLTPRQREVFHLVRTGATNREMAQQLYIAEGTVKSYITSLLNRFNLKNRVQLAIYANSVPSGS